jgi:hypothetical protein
MKINAWVMVGLSLVVIPSNSFHAKKNLRTGRRFRIATGDLTQ